MSHRPVTASAGLPIVGNVLYWALVAMVFLGALPLVAAAVQFLVIGVHRHRDHLDQCGPFFPNIAVLIPAWNEGAVIGASIDRLLSLEYPPDRLRIYVVDDASTDDTPEVIQDRAARHRGRVVHLRREKGGEGKAHTLNHGIKVLLAADWMEAMLIMDADVIYAPDSLRKLARHLADPHVGAVTAYIKEGSSPGNYMTRFIAYEYITAQAASRRAQNVFGALACLAGGAQLHSRANLEAIGGRIDTTSLAEDTFTTFKTQLAGRRVVFDGNATVLAEEPDTIDGLWKQRLRWARGNVQVSLRFKHLWFRPAKDHRLGSVAFGINWFCLFFLPVFMILSSTALVILFFVNFPASWQLFRHLWIVNAVSFTFLTSFALLIDPGTARKVWREAVFFPGAIALLIILYTCAPRPFGHVIHQDLHVSHPFAQATILLAYLWVAGCMLVGYGAKRVEKTRAGRLLTPALVYLGGFGPLLCAVTFTSYIKELRGAEMKWDKTVKTGKISS